MVIPALWLVRCSATKSSIQLDGLLIKLHARKLYTNAKYINP